MPVPRRDFLKIASAVLSSPVILRAQSGGSPENETSKDDADLTNPNHSNTMKLIAIEEHFLTREVRKAWAAASIHDDTISFNTGVWGERLDDLGEGRLRLMDETGIDVQVLSLTVPGLGDLAPAVAADLARRTNDQIAAIITSHPDRFQALATLSAPSDREAPRELERCVRELGFKGTLLCGRTRGLNLDHASNWPTFECAAALGVPILLHPQIPSQSVRDAYYSGFDPKVDLAFSSFGLGWHFEAGIQFVRLILAGVFDRFPNLQVILGHWGEVVLFYLERLAALDGPTNLQRSLIDYVRQNLYVTASGMFSPTYLQRTVDIVGHDRVLFSTDYPYQYRPGQDARHFVENALPGQDEKHKFAHANWERLTRHIPQSKEDQ